MQTTDDGVSSSGSDDDSVDSTAGISDDSISDDGETTDQTDYPSTDIEYINFAQNVTVDVNLTNPIRITIGADSRKAASWYFYLLFLLLLLPLVLLLLRMLLLLHRKDDSFLVETT